MKKLERRELKNLKGGLVDTPPGCAANSTCGKWVGGSSGHWESGTCAMGTALPNLPAICECSNGGTGCKTTGS
jgi:hypothetical protein